jgi:hypothetical protein
MDKKTISERIRSLASDNQKRSKAARLRDVIDDVEAALAAGVYQADVLAELNAHGLEMSRGTFQNTLQRIRDKRKKNTDKSVGNPAHVAFQNNSNSVIQKTASSSENIEASYNPSDIDKIINAKPDLAALSKLAKRIKK